MFSKIEFLHSQKVFVTLANPKKHTVNSFELFSTLQKFQTFPTRLDTSREPLLLLRPGSPPYLSNIADAIAPTLVPLLYTSNTKRAPRSI